MCVCVVWYTQNMQQLMDPTRNMSNYRNLLALQLQQSPAVNAFIIYYILKYSLYCSVLVFKQII